MSTYKIPNSEKQIIQANNGDYSGNLYNTYNIDLDSNPGTIKVGKKLVQILDATDFGAADRAMALQTHDGRYYLATQADVFSCSVNNDITDNTQWTDVSTFSTEDLGLETDMTSFNGFLLVSLWTDIASWDGSTLNDDWWTTVAGGTALTANYIHTMEVLRTGADTLFITDKNKIRYYNTASSATTITLDPLMNARSLTPTLDRMWVGTYTEVENNGYVYEIQVGNDAATQAYSIDGRVALTMFTYKNTPFVVTEKGYIQAFNGVGFETIARFPWATGDDVMEGCRAGLVQDSVTSTAIHPKGSKVKGRYCYMYVDTQSETSNLPLDKRSSGLWVLDLDTYSLTHRGALNDTSSDYGDYKATFSGALLLTDTPESKFIICGGTNGLGEGVWMESDTENQGYFVTTRHESDSVADAFDTFVVKADTLDTDETIVVKYKDTTLPNKPVTIEDVVWLNATQFNTSSDLTNVSVGDEVEIFTGHASGSLCHITAIEGTITQTITVDESLGLLNGISSVYVNNWTKLDTTYTEEDGEYKRFGDGRTSTNRQYKVIMKGDITLREVVSKSNNKIEL